MSQKHSRMTDRRTPRRTEVLDDRELQREVANSPVGIGLGGREPRRFMGGRERDAAS